MHPKDKIAKLDKVGVVYQITCEDCNAQYVGETERVVKKRATEHQRKTSPVGHHMLYHKHHFSTDNISILHQETNWFRRGVAEAIHIMKTDPKLNRDRGRHNLPNIYREVIMSHGLTSVSESCDHTVAQQPSC